MDPALSLIPPRLLPWESRSGVRIAARVIKLLTEIKLFIIIIMCHIMSHSYTKGTRNLSKQPI